MKNQNKTVVSIVIPCYNEENNVKVLYDQIDKIFENTGYTMEYIFVDDHSSDRTLDIIEELSMENENIKYISFSRNFGHQSALRAGLSYASGDCVLSMDADLQHPPALLKTLIQKWEEGYEVVYTIRKDSGDVSTFKRTTANFFYKLMNSMSEIELNPGSADFRLLDKKIVRVLVNEISEYHLFYRGLISWIGYKQVGVEYVPGRRYSGNSKYSVSKMISFAVDGITSFSIRPLKLAILLGLVISGLAAIYGFYVIWAALFTDETVRGWSSVLVSILFIGGVNMTLLGIVGGYVGKLYIQSKKRPYFLVEKSNFDTE